MNGKANGQQRPVVAVTIATYRRPAMLRALLDALAGQRDAPDFRVIIADNDGQAREGLAVAAQWQADGHALTVEAFAVEAKGLCHVRNALFARALGHAQVTHVALLDDDEWPEPDWLARLLRAQQATGADLVGGPVDYIFDGPRPNWADQTLIFRKDDRIEGPVQLWGAANVLIARSVLDVMGSPWFDVRFNASGGEDLDFFTRLRASGATTHWVPTARVNERVPADRASLGWAMRRMWRIGQTDMLIAQKHAGAGRRMILPFRALVQWGLKSLLLPLALINGRQRFDFLGNWIKAVGRLSVYFGAGSSPYK